MNKFFIFLFAINSIVSFSQIPDFQFEVKTEKSGYNKLKDSSIEFEIFELSERVESIYFDSISNYLTLKLRGITKNGKYLSNTGKIVQYDLNENKALWSKKFNYSINILLQKDNKLLFYRPDSSFKLDVNTGEKEWKTKVRPYIIDKDNNIMVGYKVSAMETELKDVVGVDLNTGKTIWKRSISNEYGWNDYEKRNDSILMIKAAGLHKINIKNGTGWDYDTKTGYKDYTASVVGNVLGAAAAVLTGTFVGSSGYNLVRDVVSNTIEDSTHFYMASRDQMVKINKETGVVDWFNEFEKKTASKSTIFETENNIYLVNYGKSFVGNRKLKVGKAFLAAYNKDNGEQILKVDIENDDVIEDYEELEKAILILSNNQILEIDKKTGVVKSNFKADTEDFNFLAFFLMKSNIRNKSSDEVKELESRTSYLVNEANKVFIYENLSEEKLKEVSTDNFVFFNSNFEDHQLFTKNNKLFVTKDNKIISELYMSSNAFIKGKYLWDIEGKKVKRVLISDLKE